MSDELSGLTWLQQKERDLSHYFSKYAGRLGGFDGGRWSEDDFNMPAWMFGGQTRTRRKWVNPFYCENFENFWKILLPLKNNS